MKPIPAKLKGKRIEDVLLRDSAGKGGPQHQLILCFEDGTSFEFWSSNSFHPAGCHRLPLTLRLWLQRPGECA